MFYGIDISYDQNRSEVELFRGQTPSKDLSLFKVRSPAG